MPPPVQPYTNRGEPARGSSLQTIKTQQKAREEEEKTKLRRKKGLVALILQFAQEMGYARTLEGLQADSGMQLGRTIVPADNVDLLTMCTEYEDYYEFRFGKRPKLFRAIGAVEGEAGVDLGFGIGAPAPLPAPPQRSGVSSAPPQTKPNAGGTKVKPKPTSPSLDDFELAGTTVQLRPAESVGEASSHTQQEDTFSGRVMKPLPVFPNVEMAELAAVIQRDILDQNPDVRFSHIAALPEAKQLLLEAVVMPTRYPELFEGIVRPWKGILLYGPPGTGKTMLAKAVATECRTTFFNISASSIVSKWRGDSEKLVRLLFELAVHYAPSTIFIDELDSLMSARSSEGEHEGSRRMKTELLIQMDGLSKRKNGDVVFVLAASNVPWDLDTAILRRLEKRILVGLPTVEARMQMFHDNLSKVNRSSKGGPAPCLNDDELRSVADLTEGYSGADIDVISREATMRTVRGLIQQLEGANRGTSTLPSEPLRRPPVSVDDVRASIACTKSSCQAIDLRKYADWDQAFGSTMS